VWREDAIAVNGFEQEMGYKGQDREFGDRLTHAGRRCVQVRHRAVLVHQAHDRPYATADEIAHSDRIRARTRREGAVRAREGIEELRRELAGDGGGDGRERGAVG